MAHVFDVIKRTFDDNAIVLFIDLLGTRTYWKSATPTEDQALTTIQALLGDFDIVFTKHFNQEERKDSFDVSIYTDSIVISQRKDVTNIIDRITKLALSYQLCLLQKDEMSRAIILKDAFFSFKMGKISDESILGSRYTSISLCGGRGIISAHEREAGLPIGVYVDNCFLPHLSDEFKNRIVSIKQDSSLYFVKQKVDILSLLPENTQKLLLNKPKASIKTIRHSLMASLKDNMKVDKFLPWILVHLGKDNEISRNPSRTK
ncbi:MAG: hypothetical protein ABSG44_14745 [Thermodesulfobacteriota bacterium]|jgi:hypothetical protein